MQSLAEDNEWKELFTVTTAKAKAVRADANQCSNKGLFPLFLAQCNADMNILSTLLAQKNLDVNQTPDSASVLFLAVQDNEKDIVQLLLQHGADKNRKFRSTVHSLEAFA